MKSGKKKKPLAVSSKLLEYLNTYDAGSRRATRAKLSGSIELTYKFILSVSSVERRGDHIVEFNSTASENFSLFHTFSLFLILSLSLFTLSENMHFKIPKRANNCSAYYRFVAAKYWAFLLVGAKP